MREMLFMKIYSNIWATAFVTAQAVLGRFENLLSLGERRPPSILRGPEVPASGKLLSQRPFSLVVAMAAGVASVAVAPAQAHLASSYEDNEDDAVRSFLKHQLSNSGRAPICFNTSLGRLSLADLNALKRKPPPSNPTPAQRIYAKNLKMVLAVDWASLTTSRIVTTNSQEWREMGARSATFEECEKIASYKLGRVMIRGGVGIALGGVSYPCVSNTFGISLKKNVNSWSELHVNGYYTVSVPGCGDFSKGNPGEISDSFIILGENR